MILSGRGRLQVENKMNVYGKRQTSDSRSRFLKVNDKYTRIIQNHSRAYCKHETTYHHWGTVNGKRQTRRKHGHVVTSAVCRKRDAKSLWTV